MTFEKHQKKQTEESPRSSQHGQAKPDERQVQIAGWSASMQSIPHMYREGDAVPVFHNRETRVLYPAGKTERTSDGARE